MEVRKNLGRTDFIRMHDLELKFYDESHITPYQEAYRWFLAFPWSNCSVYEEDRLAGFLDLFPVSPSVYEKIRAGTFNDADLTTEDIIDINQPPDHPVGLFLSCIVVDEDYRKSGVLKMLLEHQTDFYRHLTKEGLRVDRIITDNVTRSGELFSEKMGFTRIGETDHDSVIYEMDFNEFEKKVKSL